jgi:hypothetical protein
VKESTKAFILAIVGVLIIGLFCGKGFRQGWKNDPVPTPSTTVTTEVR